MAKGKKRKKGDGELSSVSQLHTMSFLFLLNMFAGEELSVLLLVNIMEHIMEFVMLCKRRQKLLTSEVAI